MKKIQKTDRYSLVNDHGVHYVEKDNRKKIFINCYEYQRLVVMTSREFLSYCRTLDS